MSKILQYELWHECNNFCTYCTLGRANKSTPEELKLQSIKTTLEEIKTLKKGDVHTLGLIGGEFFQGQLSTPNVKQEFFNLIKLINTKLNDGDIECFWLNATMTKGDQKDLYDTLDLIDKKEKVWILTSYDSKGRFHNMDMFVTWVYHMNNLQELYPQIKRNTTMIVTGDFIKQYLQGDLSIELFSRLYDTSVFLKTPVKPDDMCDMTRQEINEKFKYEFFPREIDFMKFLVKYLEREGESNYLNLFSNDLKAEELHKNYNNEELRNVVFIRPKDYHETINSENKEIESLPCGHSSIYQCFSDSDKCAICCKQLVASL